MAAKIPANAMKALQDKSKSSGISLSTLKTVYRRGMGAYMSSGSRPGVSMHQWAMGRVNSYIKGSKKHDTDLRKKK
jgi:hypothetical protein